MKKAISSAVSSGCSHMVIIGEDEIEKGIVSIKDLDSKEQREIDRKQILLALAE